jgi:hypothetical protein
MAIIVRVIIFYPRLEDDCRGNGVQNSLVRQSTSVTEITRFKRKFQPHI